MTNCEVITKADIGSDHRLVMWESGGGKEVRDGWDGLWLDGDKMM